MVLTFIVAILVLLPPLLLHRYDPIVFILALEIYQVMWVNLQEGERVKGMAFELLAKITLENFLRIRCNREHVHSIFGERDVVLVLLDDEASHFGLPKLKALMLEKDSPVLLVA